MSNYLKLFGISMGVTVVTTLLVAALSHLIQGVATLLDIPNEGFEFLDSIWRVGLLVSGLVLILLLFTLFRVDGRELGITHALEQLYTHHGPYPWRNVAMQFLAGGVTLSTGFVGGREGPGVHIGAWLGSWCQAKLKLSLESREVLIRVGMVAALAAGFHTMFAAVIFVYEVVRVPNPALSHLLCYTATAALAHGFAILLGVDPFELGGHEYTSIAWIDWLLLIVTALVVTGTAVLWNAVTIHCVKIKVAFHTRMLVVTIVVVACAVWLPDVLGTGFDLLDQAEHGRLEIGLGTLLAVVFAKLLLTSAGIALGVPLGVLGPALVNGGLLGVACYFCFMSVFPELVTAHISVYVLVGAATLLTGILNAPFMAFLLFLELTSASPLVGLQVGVVILLAYLCKIKVWGRESIFESRLATQGVDLRLSRH